jgi:hypothetical protein
MYGFSMIYAHSSISALLVAGISRFVPTGPPEPWFGCYKLLGKLQAAICPGYFMKPGPKQRKSVTTSMSNPLPLFAAEIFADPGILESCMNLTFQCFLVTFLESGH